MRKPRTSRQKLEGLLTWLYIAGVVFLALSWFFESFATGFWLTIAVSVALFLWSSSGSGGRGSDWEPRGMPPDTGGYDAGG